MKKTIIGVLIMLGIFATMLFKLENSKGIIFTGKQESSDSYYRPFKKDLHSFTKTMSGYNVKYGDIWIRDVAPVVTDRLVKFQYAPQYLDADQSHKLNKDFTNWLDREGFDYQQSDLILDGGNFVYNGENTAIITKRILKDNPNYTKKEIVEKLKQLLSLKQIIVINEEPGDILGHADGQVHFIQPNVLLISDFVGKEKVKKQIKKQISSIKIVDIPSSYTEQGQYDEQIPSAKGLYVNILETEDTLYLPQYGLKNDRKVYEIVQHYTNKKIRLVNMAELSTMGGSINCLTWYCPEELLPY